MPDVHTVYILKDPLPPVCAKCEERKQCMAEGFGEACCDECDHLLGRFKVIKVVRDMEAEHKEKDTP